LGFGLQQAAEGVVWVALENRDLALAHTASIVYHFFVCLWLAYFPFMALVNEPKSNNLRRLCMYFFMIVGFIFGMSKLIGWMLHYNWLEPEIKYQCIVYHKRVYKSLSFGFLNISAYFVITSLPLFISSHRILKIFGIVTIVVTAVVYYFYSYAFTSYWCFASAILSLCIVKVESILRKERDIVRH